MKSILSLFAFLLFVSLAVGQRGRDKDQDYVMIHRPIQLSLIPPLSTNGFRSGRITNSLSFNLIGGYNGGLKGMEFGGVFNIIKSHAYGTQFAGALNVVGGRTSGGQFAGVMNVSADRVKGFQGAGAVNIAAERTYGSQMAGVMNISAGNLRGIQMAGAINFAGTRFKDQEEDEWVFAADPHAIAEEKSGSKGAQFAGAVNIASGDFYGVQIAGAVNIAQRMHGYQIGVLNIAESVEDGIPIGLLSIVKDGYFRIEGGATETLAGVGSIKIGVPKFYNIFSAGVQANFREPGFAVGYGIGTKFRHGKRITYNLDAVSYQLFAGRNGWSDLNQLNRLSLNMNLHIAKRFAIYGGVAANVFVTTDRENSIAPWTVFDETYRHTRVQIYPGLQAGIRI